MSGEDSDIPTFNSQRVLCIIYIEIIHYKHTTEVCSTNAKKTADTFCSVTVH